MLQAGRTGAGVGVTGAGVGALGAGVGGLTGAGVGGFTGAGVGGFTGGGVAFSRHALDTHSHPATLVHLFLFDCPAQFCPFTATKHPRNTQQSKTKVPADAFIVYLRELIWVQRELQQQTLASKMDLHTANLLCKIFSKLWDLTPCGKTKDSVIANDRSVRMKPKALFR